MKKENKTGLDIAAEQWVELALTHISYKNSLQNQKQDKNEKKKK